MTIRQRFKAMYGFEPQEKELAQFAKWFEKKEREKRLYLWGRIESKSVADT